MKHASRGGGLAIVIMVALAVVGCGAQPSTTESDRPTHERTGCSSPTQAIKDGPFGHGIEGSSEDGLTLFGQIQADDLLVASEKVKKVVWRIGGSGELLVKLLGPTGGESSLTWGPEHYSSSNYERPGDEYGTGLILDQPGCWQIEFKRGAETASVWLLVSAP